MAQKAKEEEIELLISSHSIAELYAVLSTLPVSPRITPGMTRRLIHERVIAYATVTALSSSEYQSTIKRMSELGISGGAVYDAVIAMAAKKAGADRISTFNVADFKRTWPEGEAHIAAP